MKTYSSREVLKKLYADSWYKVGQESSHIHLKHPTKKGKVTVTHPLSSNACFPCEKKGRRL
ncbi:MAG: type II toxin-antitoxin system HicA family toxin [Defluviitaleaceae bacterium]|nr:type II toxin-antitoxin system HicA family toxin [Defluviitaleaceae bacterium]